VITALSESPVWELQREWYEARATQAFAEVPHQVVDNPFVSAAYARVVFGYLRDTAPDPDEPLYIVELGAGAGRFAHGFTRELEALLDATPLELPQVVYVMTDVAESTLADWAANPLLANAMIDFAHFDVGSTETLQLRRRGIALDALANPLVVIANYIFDSVPTDAFAIEGERLEECRLSVEGDDIETMDLSFERHPAQLPHYGDPELDDLIEHYMETLEDSVVTIPRAAIECLRRLQALSGGRMLLLTADKAYTTETGLSGRREPELSRHGSFSLMVNLHAFGLWARGRGGDMLDGGDRHTTIAVVALLLGEGEHLETRQAYDDAIERFGPDDLMTLSEGLEKSAEHMSAAELASVLRLTLWDSFTLMGIADTLLGKIAEADEATREDLRDALYEVYERHYPVPGEGDLPFTLGLLLYELDDFEEALACFEASREQYGDDAATLHNIKLCRDQLT
jgi:Putative S-adenosyl-L-methionine-dependent methyltransferase